MPADSRYSANDVKIGILVTVSLFMFTALVAVTSDVGRFFRQKKTIKVLFRNVVGLKANSPVNYSGVEVGRVKSISVVRLDRGILARIPRISPELVYELPLADRSEVERLRRIRSASDFDAAAKNAVLGRDMVLLELEVDSELVPLVREDDYVSVESNLMGDTTVEISPGSSSPIRPDQIIIGRSGSLFSRIGDAVDEIRYILRTAGTALGRGGADFDELYRKIHETADDLVAAAANFKKSSDTVFNIVKSTENDVITTAGKARSISEKADRILSTVETKAEPLVNDSAAVAAQLRSAIESMRPKAEKLLDSANSFSSKADAASSDITRTAHILLSLLQETRSDLRRSTLNVKDATGNFEDFTALIKSKPWLLLRAPRRADRETADALSYARTLLETSTRLLETADKISASAKPADPETAKALLETSRNLRRAAEEAAAEARRLADSLRPLPLKNGGRGFEKERRPADFP